MKDLAATVLSLAFVGLLWLLLAARQAGFKEQPIAFSHKKHIDQGLECAFCHTGIAEGQVRARLPELETCLACHTSEDTNPKAKLIQKYASESKPIAWKQVHRIPGHVYFSHRRHVAIAQLECAVCHGEMANLEKPVARQALPISMARCLDCHRRKGVTNDCLACHR